jgi:predicted MFS family arabinose efflux permease
VQEELHHARTLGLAVALGAALGAAMGAALGHMGVWVASGIAVYIALTWVGGRANQKSRN